MHRTHHTKKDAYQRIDSDEVAEPHVTSPRDATPAPPPPPNVAAAATALPRTRPTLISRLSSHLRESVTALINVATLATDDGAMAMPGGGKSLPLIGIGGSASSEFPGAGESQPVSRKDLAGAQRDSFVAGASGGDAHNVVIAPLDASGNAGVRKKKKKFGKDSDSHTEFDDQQLKQAATGAALGRVSSKTVIVDQQQLAAVSASTGSGSGGKSSERTASSQSLAVRSYQDAIRGNDAPGRPSINRRATGSSIGLAPLGSSAASNGIVMKAAKSGKSPLRTSSQSSTGSTSAAPVPDLSKVVCAQSPALLRRSRLTKLRDRLSKVNPGLPLMVLNSFLGSLISLTVKTLTSTPYAYPTFELVFIRSLVVSLLGVAWLSFSPTRTAHMPLGDLLLGPKGFRWMLLLRSVIGFTSIVTYYVSIRSLGIGEATVISFLTPIFVGILGRVILKEKWEAVDAASAVVSLLGVAVIAKPELLNVFAAAPANATTTVAIRAIGAAVVREVSREVSSVTASSDRMVAIMFGIASSIAGACVYIVLRKLRGAASPLHVSTCFALHSTWLSVLGVTIFEGSPKGVIAVIPQTLLEVVLLVGLLSLLGLGNQLCLNTALRYEPAAKCSCMNFLQVVFSFTVDLLVRGTIPRASDLVGAGIIVSCVLLVTVTKLRAEMKSNQKPAAAPPAPVEPAPAASKAAAERSASSPIKWKAPRFSGRSKAPADEMGVPLLGEAKKSGKVVAGQ
ncbi:hypothetical protein H9P43_000180 [Blastocladiella emersonii ATCC 22665]|nr:hypothetical protein H9P43_000180 [Blastocladiella emersonii ATCC 22665]